MPLYINTSLSIFAGIYALILAVEAVSEGVSRRWATELALLLAALGLLRLTTGFPAAGGRESFGDAADLGLVGLVFVFILLGMAARYFISYRGKFRWGGFLKPMCVSPIVLLPLLGTLPFGSQVEVLQIVSFAVLGFQNGFFWRVIFERAQKAS